jgi:hypothetical protein
VNISSRLISSFAALFCLTGSSNAAQLNIPAVYQQTKVWCWAASAEMVFRHYGVRSISNVSYQCGIVNALGGACFQNCANCVIAGGMMQNIANIISRYPATAVQVLNAQVRAIAATNMQSWFPTEIIHDNINSGHPIIVGISPGEVSMQYPPGASQHVAVLTGITGDGPPAVLTINDPYPFESGQNPYIVAGGQQVALGQYHISHNAFTNRLRWTNSIIVRPGPPR